MFKVIKTNKKTVIYHFKTFEELSDWATKNRYTQGNIKLYQTEIAMEVQLTNFSKTVYSCYDLNDYCTKLYLSRYETEGVSK